MEILISLVVGVFAGAITHYLHDKYRDRKAYKTIQSRLESEGLKDSEVDFLKSSFGNIISQITPETAQLMNENAHKLALQQKEIERLLKPDMGQMEKTALYMQVYGINYLDYMK